MTFRDMIKDRLFREQTPQIVEPVKRGKGFSLEEFFKYINREKEKPNHDHLDDSLVEKKGGGFNIKAFIDQIGPWG